MTWQPLIPWPTVFAFVAVAGALVVWSGRGRSRRPRQDLRRGAMVALAAVALAGPAVAVEKEVQVANVEVVFAVDRTGSMAAEDGPEGEPRLNAVRRDVRRIVEAAASARFAVITWDSSARVELPVTTDASAVAHFADNLRQEVTEFSTGSTLGRPAQVVSDLLESSAASRPQNRRYLVVISDGETTQGQGEPWLEEWEGVSEFLNGGAVLGYGTASGGPMRIQGVGGTGASEEFITDEAGSVALSYLDEESLQALASELGVPLLINPGSEQLTTLGEEFLAGAHVDVEELPGAWTHTYLTWVPALALVPLVAWELSVFAATVQHWRRTHAL